MSHTLSSLTQFAISLTQNFASFTKAQPEDQLKPAVKTLLEECGATFGKKVLLRSETQVAGLGGRPDFGVDVEGLLCGHIELKAPGLGGRPDRLTGRDKEQWNKFKSLPNLIYTDGNEWSLWRSGEKAGEVVRFQGDVTADGAAAVNAENAAALENLLRDFLWWQPVVPSQPRELASTLAPLCKLVRADVAAATSQSGSALSQLAKEWRALLFPDADDAAFADAYAQTLTYALLLARIEGGAQLTIESAAATIQARHNLLAQALRVLAQHGAREEIGVGLDLLLRIVNALDPAAWHQRAGKGDDPWLYFYEDFLAAYDPKLRNDRGVYYTPPEVIGAQVRLVDHLLKSRFGKKEGVAGKDVTFLDPAAGTGAYPLAILKRGLENVTAKLGEGAAVGVATEMARSLFAFEFLVGPYAVAHLRIAQAVLDAGGALPEKGVQVYLADTLESPHATPPQGQLFTRALSEEHERARRVKLQQPILVCIGNPPYDREQRETADASTRRGGWIRFGDDGGATPAPLDDFTKPAREAGQGAHLKNLYNDYVYFWRFALWKTFENLTQDAASTRGHGIVCFITAASYLRGPGFCGMRQMMRESFDELFILDLEGDNLGARPTQNVFNIQTPVAIALGVRSESGAKTKRARVRYAKLEGTREQKFATLKNIATPDDIAWRDCPDALQAPFLPRGEGDFWSWPLLTDIFPWQHSGAQFKRAWPIGESQEVLEERWKTFAEAMPEERASLFHESRDRKINRDYPDLFASTRATPLALVNEKSPQPRIERCAFRSFDRQFCFADARLGDFIKPALWKVFSDQQIYLTGMLTVVLGGGPALVATESVPDLHYFAGRGGKDVIPLWRDAAATQANLASGALAKLAEVFGEEVRAEDVFAYAYALLSTRDYVRLHWDELTIPGPRLPLTRDFSLFREAAELGHEMLRLHTYQARNLQGAPRGEVLSGSARNTKPTAADVKARVGKPEYPAKWSYHESAQTLIVGDGAQRYEYAPVAPEIMEFSVSGLSVVKSWLNYRMKGGAGKQSSPLDKIRPRAWTTEFTVELLELLWTLEATLQKQPQLAAILGRVIVGALIRADELPPPSPDERAAPAESSANENGQTAMSLDD